MSDKVKQSNLTAKLGEHVAFWLAGMPDMERTPFVATVIGVQLNMRLNLFVIYTGPLEGGGRATAHIGGAIPYDVDPTASQISETGTWMPMEEYHEKHAEFMERKQAETEARMKAEKAADRAAIEAKNKAKGIPTPPVPSDPIVSPADPVIQSPPSPDAVDRGGRKIQPVKP